MDRDRCRPRESPICPKARLTASGFWSINTTRRRRPLAGGAEARGEARVARLVENGRGRAVGGVGRGCRARGPGGQRAMAALRAAAGPAEPGILARRPAADSVVRRHRPGDDGLSLPGSRADAAAGAPTAPRRFCRGGRRQWGFSAGRLVSLSAARASRAGLVERSRRRRRQGGARTALARRHRAGVHCAATGGRSSGPTSRLAAGRTADSGRGWRGRLAVLARRRAAPPHPGTGAAGGDTGGGAECGSADHRRLATRSSVPTRPGGTAHAEPRRIRRRRDAVHQCVDPQPLDPAGGGRAADRVSSRGARSAAVPSVARYAGHAGLHCVESGVADGGFCHQPVPVALVRLRSRLRHVRALPRARTSSNRRNAACSSGSCPATPICISTRRKRAS